MKGGDSYTAYVEAFNEIGSSGPSDPFNFELVYWTEPITVVNTEIDPDDATKVIVSWEKPYENGADITQYKVQFRGADNVFVDGTGTDCWLDPSNYGLGSSEFDTKYDALM